MQLSDIIGQDKLVDRIGGIVESGRLPHAVLLTGMDGYGLLNLAIATATEILKLGSKDKELTVRKCREFNHPDLHFVYPVNTTDKVKSKPRSEHFVGEWREFLQSHHYPTLYSWLSHLGIKNKQGLIPAAESESIIHKISLKSFESGYKVMIIWHADKMNQSSANKLLKILEEPPEKTVFLLTAQTAEDLLQTIVSRTQVITVPRIADADVSRILQNSYAASENQARTIAHLAEGDVARALEALDSDAVKDETHKSFEEWMRLAYARQIPQLVKWSDKMSGLGREEQKHFFEYGLHIFRECLIHNFGSAELQRLEGNEQAFVAKFSPFVHQNNCTQLIELLSQAHYHISRNANAKILFLNLSIQVVKLLRTPQPQL